MESRKESLLPKGRRAVAAVMLILGGVAAVCLAYGQEQGKTSYMKVDSTESFASIRKCGKTKPPSVCLGCGKG